MGSRPGYETMVSTTVKELKQAEKKSSAYMTDVMRMSGVQTAAQQSAITEAFEELDEGMRAMDGLSGKWSSATLTKEYVRQEFLKTVVPSLEGMGLSESDIGTLTEEAGNAYQVNKLESVRASLKEKFFRMKIKNGVMAEEEKWAHVAAFNLVRASYDSNDANDVVVDPLKSTVSKHKRNLAIKNNVRNFLENPKDNISFTSKGTGYRIGNLSIVQDKKHNNSDINYSYRKEHQVESFEFSNIELMDKLLEVQQLIFSNLVKE
jgi:hypothetical protein